MSATVCSTNIARGVENGQHRGLGFSQGAVANGDRPGESLAARAVSKRKFSRVRQKEDGPGLLEYALVTPLYNIGAYWIAGMPLDFRIARVVRSSEAPTYVVAKKHDLLPWCENYVPVYT